MQGHRLEKTGGLFAEYLNKKANTDFLRERLNLPTWRVFFAERLLIDCNEQVDHWRFERFPLCSTRHGS